MTIPPDYIHTISNIGVDATDPSTIRRANLYRKKMIVAKRATQLSAELSELWQNRKSKLNEDWTQLKEEVDRYYNQLIEN